MAALAGGNVDEARTAYESARGAGARGVSLAAIGLADLAMYRGRFDDAVPLLEAGIADDEQGKNMAGAAAKSIALAEAQVRSWQRGCRRRCARAGAQAQ